jgi:hypothetical protein
VDYQKTARRTVLLDAKLEQVQAYASEFDLGKLKRGSRR